MGRMLTWRFLRLYADRIDIEVPDQPIYSFRLHELEKAVQLRDLLCEKQRIVLYRERPVFNYHNHHDKADQSLPPGITREVKVIRCERGREYVSDSFRCTVDGKTYSRSVKKYGEQTALDMVIHWQAEEQDKLAEKRRKENAPA